MRTHKTLDEIAKKAEDGANCTGRAYAAAELARQAGLYAERVSATSKQFGHEITRTDGKGRRKITNFHDVCLVHTPEGEFIIDPDSQRKVYSLEDYKKECFPNPDSVDIGPVNES